MLQNRPLQEERGGTISLRFQSKSTRIAFLERGQRLLFLRRAGVPERTGVCWNGRFAPLGTRLHVASVWRRAKTLQASLETNGGDGATLTSRRRAAEFEPNISLRINSPLGVSRCSVLLLFIYLFINEFVLIPSVCQQLS